MEGPSRRFFCDAMLGRLATWLRVLGMDVEYERDIDDDILIKRAISEDRLVITRDIRLIKRRLLRGRFFLYIVTMLRSRLLRLRGVSGLCPTGFFQGVCGVTLP